MRGSMIRHKGRLERIVYHYWGMLLGRPGALSMPRFPLLYFSKRQEDAVRRAVLASLLRQIRHTARRDF
jgi:hypothetical protein